MLMNGRRCGGRSQNIANYSSDDYISYMDESTKTSRRIMWQNYNFAGTIDWAVDLQAFSGDDMEHIPDRPKFDKGCVSGE